MKRIIILIATSLLIATATAQTTTNQPVKDLEGEVSLGFNAAGQKLADKNILGINLGLELRHNFEKPFDIGVRFDQSFGGRVITEKFDVQTRSTTLQVFSDYNFRRGSNFAPFVGIGIGYIGASNVYDYSFDYENTQNFQDQRMHSAICTPRVGIEFYNCFRFTLSYGITKANFQNFRLSLGICIGGGRINKNK